MNNELLVVRVCVGLKPSHFASLMENIALQKTTGTVVLPHYCEVLVVPKDIEVKFENDAKKLKDYNPVQKAYDLLQKFHDSPIVGISEIEEAIGYLGEALE